MELRRWEQKKLGVINEKYKKRNMRVIVLVSSGVIFYLILWLFTLYPPTANILKLQIQSSSGDTSIFGIIATSFALGFFIALLILSESKVDGAEKLFNSIYNSAKALDEVNSENLKSKVHKAYESLDGVSLDDGRKQTTEWRSISDFYKNIKTLIEKINTGILPTINGISDVTSAHQLSKALYSLLLTFQKTEPRLINLLNKKLEYFVRKNKFNTKVKIPTIKTKFALFIINKRILVVTVAITLTLTTILSIYFDLGVIGFVYLFTAVIGSFAAVFKIDKMLPNNIHK